MLNVLREDQGAPGIAGALSGAGIHHHHQKGGSAVQHQMKEAHKSKVAHPQGTEGRPMDQSTVAVREEKVEALLMMLMGRRIGVTEALLKKMGVAGAAAAAVASVQFRGMTGAQLMTMIIMALQEEANRTRSCLGCLPVCLY